MGANRLTFKAQEFVRYSQPPLLKPTTATGRTDFRLLRQKSLNHDPMTARLDAGLRRLKDLFCFHGS